jgi:TPR repeat protein
VTQLSPALTSALVVAKMFNTLNGRDFDGAVMMATDLAKANNPRGGFVLGLAFENGTGEPKDYVKARQYFTWAVRLGDAQSALSLAQLLEKGVGGAADPSAAQTLYLFAARNAVVGADKELARLNLSGKRGGTIVDAYNALIAGQNVAQASQFMQGMYNAKSGLAYCAVGWLHINRKVVQVDLGKAALMLRDGAARGFGWCALGMAQLATTGAPGVPQNLVEAHIWYDYGKAYLSSGQAEIEQRLSAIESQMSQQDVLFARTTFTDMTTPRAPLN